MTYYLKYRSQTVDELDLVEVRETLLKILKSKTLPHAWLFCGSRGTGKTSSARILAKVVNCTGKDKPCNECEMCVAITNGSAPDVMEIDAASNRGIDEIRQLRDKAALAPMAGGYKVFIIDEVHMLTTEAANALLKTLEEPPEKTMFILCTTEADKLPETVVSRCTVVKFKKPSVEEIVTKLTKVAAAENVKVANGGLEDIARAAKGSFRDAIKLLEQVAMAGGDVGKTLGTTGGVAPDDFLTMVMTGQTEKALAAVQRVVEEGGNLRGFVERVVEEARTQLLADYKHAGSKELMELIGRLDMAYERMKTAAVVQLPLEIMILEYAKSPEKPEVPKEPENQKPRPVAAVAPEPEVSRVVAEDKGKYSLEDVNARWQEIMRLVRPKNHSVEALLRSTKPAGFDGRNFVLEAFYEFHKKKLETEKCREIVETTVGEVFGVPQVVLKLRLGEAVKRNMEPNVAAVSEEDVLVKAAVEIFK